MMKNQWILLGVLSLFSCVIFGQGKRINSVGIVGLQKTKMAAILKIIEVDKNQLLDSAALHSDMVRLKRLPAISHAYFTVSEPTAEGVNISYILEENRTLIPVVNFWTTTNKQFAYKVGLYEYNFLGRNITLGGYYQHNGYHSYELNFKAPYIFSNQLGLAINHQNWTSEEPLYFGNGSANYKYQNISLETMLLYQLNFKNNLEFGVNFFKEKYQYKNGITAATIPQELNINKLLFKFVYAYNNLDYWYQYVSGFKSQLYAQMVTTENEFQDDFLIAWNDFFYYKRLGKKGNWANRLRIGLSTNNDSPFAPFALDNNVNLRGVGILVDRGTGSIVYNTEYRHTLLEKGTFVIQSNLFVDAGTWRKPGGGIGDFIKKENMRFFSGVGLRIINKKVFNAIFRIDYGFELTDGKSKGLVFGIGQYF